MAPVAAGTTRPSFPRPLGSRPGPPPSPWPACGRGYGPGVGGRHPEVPLASGRWRGDRVGAHSDRDPPDPLHLLPGRAAPCAVPSAPPGRMGYRRNLTPFEIAGPGSRDRPPEPEADARRTSSSWAWASRCSTGPSVDTRPHHPEPARRARDRRAAHHGLDRGDPARHGGVRPTSGAVPAGHLAPRHHVLRSGWASCRSRRSTISRRCSGQRKRSGSG